MHPRKQGRPGLKPGIDGARRAEESPSDPPSSPDAKQGPQIDLSLSLVFFSIIHPKKYGISSINHWNKIGYWIWTHIARTHILPKRVKLQKDVEDPDRPDRKP